MLIMRQVHRFLRLRRTESVLSLLIVASCVAIVLESFADLKSSHELAFRHFEQFVVLVFTLEYVLRIWSAPLAYPKLSPWRARMQFVTSFGGFVDLLAILPFYLPLVIGFDLRFLRVLRLSRLLRILKLYRYSEALRIIGRSFYDRRSELSMAIVVTMVLLLFSSTLMWYLEREAQPEAFPNILASFWWAIATLTTVGYGDVYPITSAGKFMGGIIALLGVGLVALPAGILSASFVEHFEQEQRLRTSPQEDLLEQNAEAAVQRFACSCPNCGTQMRVEAVPG